ncbi:MAG: hypothetical protein COV45_06690 [Deltaproteobacteria bacterium CG11_big_fil_rev_8_21_14_0_20_47_16]|nr:MAG: hypothetical protein COV45_06690 [Deltaproteobacteria bacterium CG11_big_fil_rev_8_21_14_0_20_47_16]
MPEVLNKEKLLEQAKLLADQGKLDRAVQEYQKVLQMDPKDLRLKLRVAELYVKQKKMTEAIQTYQEVADSYCEDAFYLKAVTVYKNILRLNPSLLDVNRKLADLYEKMGLATDAIHQYQIVANMLEQKGMDKELLEVREKIVAIAPETSVHRIRLAEAYQLCGDEDKALNEYEVLVQQLRESGTPEQLIELYEKILAHRPDNVEMVRALCATYTKMGEWKKALKRMETSQTIVLQDPEMLTQMAEFYARQNQMATAGEKYSDLAELYIARQEIENAIKAYAASVVYTPEEEAHVKEVVEQLSPNAGDLFGKAIEERRAWLAQKEADEEAAETARVANEAATKELEAAAVATKSIPAAAQVVEGSPAKVKIVDVKALKRDIESALQLVVTYLQMSLMDEAKEELHKAEVAYNSLLQGAAEDATLKARIDDCRAKFSGPAKPVSSAPQKASPARPSGTRLPGAEKKKRISFV